MFTRLKLLNQHSDHLAKIARETIPSVNKESTQFYGEGISKWHQGNKSYKIIYVEYILCKKAEPIVCNKIWISPQQFWEINWQAQEKAKSLLTPNNSI